MEKIKKNYTNHDISAIIIRKKRDIMKKIETTDNLLKNIIAVSNSIDNQYQALLIARIDENEENEKEALENIKIVTEYENELYNKLNLGVFPSEQLENRFLYLLRKSEQIDILDQNYIYSRFLNYIDELTIRNPFPSINENIAENIDENIRAIERQINRDYTITFLFLLSQELNKTEDPIAKCALLEEYLYVIYKEKSLKKYLTTPPTQTEKGGRKRCLIFNQEEDLVNETYQTILKSALYEDIENALKYTDNILTEFPEEAIYLIPLLLSITANAMLLEKEERKKPLVFPKEETQNSYQSCQQILIALSNASYLDSTYQKRKVYHP